MSIALSRIRLQPLHILPEEVPRVQWVPQGIPRPPEVGTSWGTMSCPRSPPPPLLREREITAAQKETTEARTESTTETVVVHLRILDEVAVVAVAVCYPHSILGLVATRERTVVLMTGNQLLDHPHFMRLEGRYGLMTPSTLKLQQEIMQLSISSR
jgi:hypothetical protein